MVVSCENVSVDHDESLLFGEVRRASPKNISEKKRNCCYCAAFTLELPELHEVRH